MDWIRPVGSGLLIRVRLTPKSATDRIEGVETGADGTSWLKARVHAVPAGGAANTALVTLLAKAIGVPKSALGLVSGAAARIKTIQVDTRLAPETVQARLESGD